jgi:type I restriction enzyme S subunit
MQSQVGISREGLSMRNLKEFLLPIPPLDEQNRIVAKVNQLTSLCDELEAKLRQAEADSEKLMNAAVNHVLDSVRNVSKQQRKYSPKRCQEISIERGRLTCPNNQGTSGTQSTAREAARKRSSRTY